MNTYEKTFQEENKIHLGNGFFKLGLSPERWIIINEKGKSINNDEYTWIAPRAKKFFVCTKKDALCGIVDLNGKTILDFNYELITPDLLYDSFVEITHFNKEYLFDINLNKIIAKREIKSNQEDTRFFDSYRFFNKPLYSFYSKEEYLNEFLNKFEFLDFYERTSHLEKGNFELFS